MISMASRRCASPARVARATSAAATRATMTSTAAAQVCRLPVSAVTREAHWEPLCARVPGASLSSGAAMASGEPGPVQVAVMTAGRGRLSCATSVPSQGASRWLTASVLSSCGFVTPGMVCRAVCTAPRRLPSLAASGASGWGTWMVSAEVVLFCHCAASMVLASVPATARAARKLMAATSTGSIQSASTECRPRESVRLAMPLSHAAYPCDVSLPLAISSRAAG